MKLFLITYELNGSRDYSSFFDAIKQFGAWWHYIDNSWVVKTNKNPSEITDKLKPHLDSIKDSLLVIEIKASNKQGWLPKKAYSWFKRNA